MVECPVHVPRSVFAPPQPALQGDPRCLRPPDLLWEYAAILAARGPREGEGPGGRSPPARLALWAAEAFNTCKTNLFHPLGEVYGATFDRLWPRESQHTPNKSGGRRLRAQRGEAAVSCTLSTKAIDGRARLSRPSLQVLSSLTTMGQVPCNPLEAHLQPTCIPLARASP